MNKKKLLFAAYNLDLGGIETALVNLLNNMDYNLYDITLILEHKNGIFLDEIPNEVNVIEYKVSSSKCVPIRKILNRLKLIWWKIKLNNKYDFACLFATYSIPGSHLVRAASKNTTLWMHANYYIDYGKDENELKKFLDSIFATKFKRIVFVSHENMKDVCEHYHGLKEKSIVCNNFIDGEKIIESIKEPCELTKTDVPLFINVGRHEEHQKKISRIINASKRLIDEGYKFEMILIGDGPDTEKYKDLVHRYDLDNVIHFLGRKKNPFPYYNISDAVVMSSDYEGYPVVFLEAMIIGKPLISTKVSDYELIEKTNGIFVDKSEDGIYNGIKQYLENGYTINQKMDYKLYNQNIKINIEKMIHNK